MRHTAISRGDKTMLEMGRILAALGLPISVSGLIIYAIGASHVIPNDSTMNIGMIMMIGGLIAGIVGIVMYRQTTED
jgi:hypothetical protein